jgi:hypothetical protein
MKIGKRVIDVLENFQRINSQILILPGNRLSTMTDTSPGSSSGDGNIIAFADVEESFPIEFGIHDLSTFISSVKMMGPGCDLDWNENFVTISNGTLSLRYHRTPSTLINATPGNSVIDNDSQIEVDVEHEAFAALDKLSSVNNLPFLRVTGDGSFVKFEGFGEDTDNIVKMNVGEYEGPEFKIIVVWSHLKMLKTEYTMYVDPERYIRFVAKNGGWIDYVIAVKDS